MKMAFSLCCFCLAIALVAMGFGEAVHWPLLLLAAACFWLAWLVWPSRRRGRRSDEPGWLDLLEIIIELPVQLFTGMLRWLGRLFRDGADLDL